MKTEASLILEVEPGCVFGPEVANDFIGKTYQGWLVIEAKQVSPRKIILTVSGELKFKVDSLNHISIYSPKEYNLSMYHQE